MTNYPKADADIFLPHMPDVARCELSLRELNQMWRLIESSAKMSLGGVLETQHLPEPA